MTAIIIVVVVIVVITITIIRVKVLLVEEVKIRFMETEVATITDKVMTTIARISLQD
jgi:hypothetical protein